MNNLSNLYIRKFNEKDAESCSEMIFSTIEISLSEAYSTEQRDFLKKGVKAEVLSKKANEDYVIVVQKDDHPVGIALLRENYISKVYVKPEIQGKGLGRILMTILEKRAETRQHKEIILDSFLNSVGFYAKIGYQELPEQEQPPNHGLKIVRMKKTLAENPEI